MAILQTFRWSLRKVRWSMAAPAGRHCGRLCFQWRAPASWRRLFSLLFSPRPCEGSCVSVCHDRLTDQTYGPTHQQTIHTTRKREREPYEIHQYHSLFSYLFIQHITNIVACEVRETVHDWVDQHARVCSDGLTNTHKMKVE